MNDLISIILPVYNGELYLAEAIESCLNQTYSTFELIIVNDKSTDRTLKIAEKYALQDQRISIISNEVNKKLPASLNIGHKRSQGDFVTWTSHDNLLKPNFIETLIKPLKGGWDISFSNYDIIWDNRTLKRQHESDPISYLIFGNIIGAAFMYKKEVFNRLNGYDEELYTIEDYDFWLRASTKFSIYHIEENTYQYRLQKDSLTHNILNDRKTKEKFNRLKQLVYEKLAGKLDFHTVTLSFLSNIECITFNIYKNDYSVIKTDLLYFNAKINSNSSSKTVEKLDLVIRDYLKRNNRIRTFENLKWIIKNQSGVLFNKKYSKKQTLILLRGFLIRS